MIGAAYVSGAIFFGMFAALAVLQAIWSAWRKH